MGSVYYDPAFWDAVVAECDRQKVRLMIHTGDVSEGMSNRTGHVFELKQNGALMVPNICDSKEGRGRWHFLGHDEGDLRLGGVWIKLWHGLDGAAYAISYRIQKIVESFTGGEKPQVLLLGHDHKSISMFDRNIHCVGGGCLSRQSKWMRGKRIAAHMGWWMIEMVVADAQVKSFTTTWHPFFS